jgi:outer membrane usher protein
VDWRASARAALIAAACLVPGTAAALKLDSDCSTCVEPQPGPAVRSSDAAPPLQLRLDPECVACSSSESARAPAATETFVALSVNLEPKGDVLVLLTQDGDVLMREEDFKALDVRTVNYTPSVVDGVPYVPLRAVQGLQIALNLEKLELRLEFDPRVLARNQIIDLAPQRRPDVLYPRPEGAFFNYNFTASGSDQVGMTAAGAAGEIGWRTGDWLLLSDGFVNDDRVSGRTDWRRLSTSLTRDDRDTFQRTTLGDYLYTPISPLGSTLRLGGASFSKLYSLDPYVVRFPGQIITGTATLPSEVSLYSNGILVRRQSVSPGAFELQNIINIPGLNVTEVVIRDILGNEQRIANPYYFSDQLLRRDFDEYTFDVGFERRNFGLANADYGSLGAAGFYRRGVTDAITLGARGEALGSRYSVGPVSTLSLGTAGLLSLGASAGSAPEGSGFAFLVGHSYQRPLFGSSIAVRTETRNYPSASSTPVIPRKYDLAGSVGFSVTADASLSLSFTSTQFWVGDRSTASAASYRIRFGADTAVTLTARHQSAPFTANEILAALTFTFDVAGQRPNATLQLGRSAGQSTELYQIAGSPTGREEGAYYRATLDRATGGDLPKRELASGFLQYNFQKFSARAEYNQDIANGPRTYVLGASGAVAQVGGVWGASRAVSDSFGAVKVGEVPGVRVYANNSEVGRTDEHGELFIPRLASSFENAVSIEDRDLPIDRLVPQTRYYVVPGLRSGVRVDFPVRRVQAVAGRLTRADGTPFGNAEGELQVGGKALPIFASRDGGFYVEDVGPGAYSGTARRENESCTFRIEVPVTTVPVAELGHVTCQ